MFIAGVPQYVTPNASAYHLSLTEPSRLGLTFRKRGNNFEGLWVNIHAEFDRIEQQINPVPLFRCTCLLLDAVQLEQCYYVCNIKVYCV